MVGEGDMSIGTETWPLVSVVILNHNGAAIMDRIEEYRGRGPKRGQDKEAQGH